MKVARVFVVRVYRTTPDGAAEGVVEAAAGRRRRGFSNARDLWDAVTGRRRTPRRSRNGGSVPP
ncbi:MAG: hypothetical protein U1F52_00665 [Burkholderiales bacterium]